MPLAPPTPVMYLVVDLEEEEPEEDEEEEDPSEDPMDDEERAKAEVEQAPKHEPVQPVPRGARPIVISTQPRMIRMAIVPRGHSRGDGVSTSQALPMTSEDRPSIRE